MELIHVFNLSLGQWFWVIIAAFLIGFSKTGISGFIMPVVPIFASVFGGKESTGIVLPILLVGDVFALYYYKRHAEWSDIKRLLPWALVGLILGAIVGNCINDKQFKTIISVMVIICLIILVYIEKKGEEFKVPKRTWFYALTGMISGFASMIGNAAGPIFSIYLLAMDFKKNGYMGTTSWFFFIINLIKLPLQILFWNNISLKTGALAIALMPAIALGALLGAIIIRRLNEKPFRYIIIAMTALAAVRLLM